MKDIHCLEGTIDRCFESIYCELSSYEIDDLKEALEYVRGFYPHGINLIGMVEDRLHAKEEEEEEKELEAA